MKSLKDPLSLQKRGWLKKKGNNQGLWHNRYVSISDHSIIVSKDDAITNIDIVIPMTPDVTFDLVRGASNPRFQIKPSKDSQPILFSAYSSEEISEWFNVFRSIQSACSKLSMDDFQIISVLGRGYYGKVMLCKRNDNDQLYAIKSIRKSLINEVEGCSVLTEKNIMMKIHHPFIVSLRFAFQSDRKVYLGLEYASGGELFYYMEKNGVVPIDDARLYIAEIGLALTHLHKYGIIYRDLKPENVLFDADGHIKLTDFGLSKELNGASGATTFCGTPDYLAPEVVLSQEYGTKIDEWALGILTYEMIFGRTPFYNENKSILFQNIVESEPFYPEDADERIVDFMKKLLEKDPKKRATFEEIQSHPFFEGVDWNAVLGREYMPSYIPQINDRFSTQNFDPEFTNEIAVDSFVTPGMSDLGNIAGFSFVQTGLA